ncbi:MAG: DUF1549 domain-containing protein [Spirochaetes bacterium]|nr:DUF1549 domain-containing protein [Spirochaetota bacterium]
MNQAAPRRALRFLIPSILLLAALQGAKEQKGIARGKPGEAFPHQTETLGDAWRSNAAVDAEAVRRGAASIDAAVAAYWKRLGLVPAGAAPDEVYLRRVTLDLAGRIPTAGEYAAFLADSGPDRRFRTALALVRSEGYVDHFYNLWAGLLRIPTANPGNGIPNRSYEFWVKAALRENMPYDEFVRRLVAADGKASEENGAAGFVLRDQMQGILDHFSQTATVFLSSQVGCAMCHNAKFEPWTQKQFYQMAAFFSELNLTKDPAVMKLLREEEKAPDKTPQMIAEIRRRQREEPWILSDVRGRELKLPANYVYDSNEAGKAVRPATLFGPQVVLDPDQPRRAQFAQWLTSPENPNFTRSIANRLWKRLIGIGLIEPVDDLSPDNKASAPEVLAALTNLMVSSHYNLKVYTAAIAASRVYGLATAPETVTWHKYRLVSHPLRRMSAEQLWDSMAALFQGEKIRERQGGRVAHQEAPGMLRDQAMQGKPIAGVASAMESPGGTMMIAANSMTPMPGVMAAGMAPSMTMAPMAGAGGDKKYKGVVIPLACELPSPIRAGTFLDQFGVPSRESVSEGNQDPSMIQALFLMNANEVQRLITASPQNQLFVELKNAPDLRAVVRAFYVRFFTREPTEGEVAALGAYAQEMKASGGKGVLNQDIAWALLNQREFLFYP